jgi:hypothetical protein
MDKLDYSYRLVAMAQRRGNTCNTHSNSNFSQLHGLIRIVNCLQRLSKEFGNESKDLLRRHVNLLIMKNVETTNEIVKSSYIIFDLVTPLRYPTMPGSSTDVLGRPLTFLESLYIRMDILATSIVHGS